MKHILVLTAALLLLLPAAVIPVSAECVHQWSEWVVETAASPDIIGNEIRTCDYCGETEWRDLIYDPSASVHTCAGNGVWINTAERHTMYCSCGELFTQAAHVFGQYLVVTEATAETTGIQRRICTVCGYPDEKSIPMLIPEENDTTEPVQPEQTEPKASDTAPTVPEPEKETSADVPSQETTPEKETAPILAADTQSPFIDVSSSDAAFAAVRFVYDHDLFLGIETADGMTFAPDMTMTRAMFVTVLGRLAGADTAAYKAESIFSDVKAGDWYAPYVAWAQKNGIVIGYDNGTFGINDEISIEQAAVILARYAEYAGERVFDASYRVDSYADSAAVSPWARLQLGWCLYRDIYIPVGNELYPGHDASREWIAILLYNYTAVFG